MRFSPLVYQAMLRLYPEDLQRDFGEDMADAFTEELLRAWRERGLFRKAVAMAGVWLCAASELVTIAIPAKLANPALGRERCRSLCTSSWWAEPLRWLLFTIRCPRASGTAL